jgi:hypothetical protein
MKLKKKQLKQWMRVMPGNWAVEVTGDERKLMIVVFRSVTPNLFDAGGDDNLLAAANELINKDLIAVWFRLRGKTGIETRVEVNPIVHSVIEYDGALH